MTKRSLPCYVVAITVLSHSSDPTHGTPQQREVCFYYGYVHGPDPFYTTEPDGKKVVDCGQITWFVGEITFPTGVRRDNAGELVATAQKIRIIISSITLDGQHIGPQPISPPGVYVAAEGVLHRTGTGEFFELQALYDGQSRKHEVEQMVVLRNCGDSDVAAC
jgi:hypothetical protein